MEQLYTDHHFQSSVSQSQRELYKRNQNSEGSIFCPEKSSGVLIHAWEHFEQTGAVEDYLHYLMVKRDQFPKE